MIVIITSSMIMIIMASSPVVIAVAVVTVVIMTIIMMSSAIPAAIVSAAISPAIIPMPFSFCKISFIMAVPYYKLATAPISFIMRMIIIMAQPGIPVINHHFIRMI